MSRSPCHPAAGRRACRVDDGDVAVDVRNAPARDEPRQDRRRQRWSAPPGRCCAAISSLPGESRASWVADNYNHLHEAPTVFYAVALTLAMIGQGDNLNVTIAWAYVALRIAHSIVQATFNRVAIRFGLFALSTVPLLMLITHAMLSLLH